MSYVCLGCGVAVTKPFNFCGERAHAGDCDGSHDLACGPVVLSVDRGGATALYARLFGLEERPLPEEIEWICAAFAAVREEAQRVATAATDATVRAQLEMLGLAGRFPSLTHLADDIGEALLSAEAGLAAARLAWQGALVDLDDAQKKLAAAREENRHLVDHVNLALRIADYEEDHRRVVAGECAPDERHCSCVPHLRREIAWLRQGIAEAAYDLDQADNPASATDLRDLLAENTDGITVADTWQMAAEDAQAERDAAQVAREKECANCPPAKLAETEIDKLKAEIARLDAENSRLLVAAETTAINERLDNEQLRQEVVRLTEVLHVSETRRIEADNERIVNKQLRQESVGLRRLLALAAIPLEALHASEQDGTALHVAVKQGIADAVREIRAEFAGGPR